MKIYGLVDYDFNVLRNNDIHCYYTRREKERTLSMHIRLVRTNYGKDWLIYEGFKEGNVSEMDSLLLFRECIREHDFSYFQLFLILILLCNFGAPGIEIVIIIIVIELP